MASTSGSGAQYQFNNFKEIKSHSSVLYNERMAILFYLLDMKGLMLHRTESLEPIYEVFSILKQIYKNIRMLLRFNQPIRVTMNLETKDKGVYTTDIAMSTIQKMIKYCENHGFTLKRVEILKQELDNMEMQLKDILQYFNYFIRPDFKQKPDVEMATEKYKEIADAQTVEQLKEFAGKSNQIDFNSLGGDRVELDSENSDVDYDPKTDGKIEEYEDESEDESLELDDEDEE